MRLELGFMQIKDVRFVAKTAIEDGVLSVNRAELVALLEQEPLFDRVDLEIAHPGESCRILRVLDVLEPRYRLDGPNFPGALDSNGLVGDGRTRALKNVAVVETDQLAPRSRSLIDMSGPAAQYSPIGNTHNVVVLAYPKNNVDKNDYRLAVKKAGLEPEESQIGKFAENNITLEGQKAQQMLKLIETLEDNDDVQSVWSNFDISDKELEAAAAAG